MAFDAAAIIRAGSGLMFMAVGLVALGVRRFQGRTALATACLAFGASAFMINLVFFLEPNTTVTNVALVGQSLAFWVFAAALVWFLFSGPWCREAPQRRWLMGGVLVAGGVSALSILALQSWIPAFAGIYGKIFQGSNAAFYLDFDATYGFVPFAVLFGIVAAIQAKRSTSTSGSLSLAALTLGLTLYSSYDGGSTLQPYPSPGSLMLPGLSSVTILAVPVAWSMLLKSTARRHAWLVILGTLAAILFGLAEPILLGGTITGGPGLVRALAAVSVGFALLRGGLDGQEPQRLVIRKGTWAAASLAVLFIVAQVAQNFFSAEYGLLTGGIVAGVFLFAASPIQRSIEAMAGSGRRPGRGTGKEEAYSSALRFALRDRTLSPEERIQLGHVADELGLTSRRAAEIEAEVLAAHGPEAPILAKGRKGTEPGKT